MSFMYLSAVYFIRHVKTGPFMEHSHILYDIAKRVRTWSDVASGLLRMFRAEVLGKFPVAQHFRFGQLLPATWNSTDDGKAPGKKALAFTAVAGPLPTGAHPGAQRGTDALSRYFGMISSKVPSRRTKMASVHPRARTCGPARRGYHMEVSRETRCTT